MWDDFDPLEQMGLITFIDGEHEVADSVKLKLTGAHSPGHQIMTVKDKDITLVCPCEIVPSAWHLRLSWVTGYDQEPARVVEIKRELMRQAEEENWIVFLTHDPTHFFGYLRDAGDREYTWEPRT